MLNIDQVFMAESQSIFDFLTIEGQGCHIPAYQRPYSWDNTNVTRLLEDATLGLEQLTADKAAVRFLGTIIGVNGQGLVGAPAPLDRELPRQVKTIIDGQQRLCTLVVLNILLHDEIGRLLGANPTPASEVAHALLEEGRDFLDELAKTYEFKRRNAPELHNVYPRIIRAMDDCWARAAAAARYDSPIARFIWAYIAHTHGDGEAPFEYRALDDQGRSLPGHEALAGVIDFLRAEIGTLAANAHSTFKLPPISTPRTNASLIEELWKTKAPLGAETFLDEGDETDPEFRAVCHVLRLTALGGFVNFRMAATVVTAGAEDYAFDMFEALNTTGQPLTAFETFKPKVVEAEGGSYPTSSSRKSIEAVERYLNRFRKAEERQTATSTMLIPFALAETGYKLEKHLSHQRRYLREQYASAGALAAKRKFVGSLANTADFVGAAWRPPGRRSQPQLLPDPALRDAEAEFCFEVLRDIHHEIALAPLIRFYSAYLAAAPGTARDNAAAAFFGAVKAVTAFSMIWRASKGGTANVDGAYRDLMAKGVGGVAAFCAGKTTTPTLKNLRTALLALLAGEAIDRTSWIRDASQAAIYWTGQSIARFLLMAAAHDTVPSKTDPAMLEAGRKGTLNLLSREAWRDVSMLTVEHVAPGSEHSSGWPADVYDDQRTIQRLGNLVLMPQIENNVLANRPWEQKRILYSMFGAKTAAEAQVAIDEAMKVGFSPTETAKELVKDASFLPMCASIKDFGGPWDEAFIERRSEHLAGLAWDRIYPWLSPQRKSSKPAKAKGGGKKPLSEAE